ncbi:MAG: GntR family transcriptional regulator [Treponema sp.]|nr:GntR family transcriptional regulator [Treponema sp.]
MNQIEYDVLGIKVYRALKTMIIKGELKPGQKLIQDTIANQLGVSRTPLLAAFSRLENENLLITIPRRGSYVRQYTDKEFADLCNIRTRLETLAAREAASAQDRDLTALETILKNYEKALKKNDVTQIIQCDYDFHMEIIEIGGNRFLQGILGSWLQVILNMNQNPAPKTALADHHEILEAIKKGNPDKAEAIMQRHTYNEQDRNKRPF